MNKRFNMIALTAAVAALTSACGGGERRMITESVGSMDESSFAINHNPVHSATGWATLLEFYVADNAPSQIVEAAKAAAASWNDAAGRDVIEFAGRRQASAYVSLYDPLEDNFTLIYYESNWRERTSKSKTTLATAVWENDVANRSLINKADIILNAETYLFQDAMDEVLDDDRYLEVVDTETVLLHEMGHILGLDHVPLATDDASVMHAFTQIGSGITNRMPSRGDAERIQSIYNR